MKKGLLKLLLFAALFVPWVTQAQTTCQIKIVGEDGYGDGWNGGSLAIMQGSTTVATFNGANFPEYGDGSEFDSTMVTVNSGTPVTFVWTSGQYDDEVTIWIYDGSGAMVYTVTQPTAGTIYTMNTPCPSCIAPMGLTASVTGSDVDLSWTAGTGTDWQIVWGTGSFNPDTVTVNLDYVSTNSYSFTNLDDGQYTAYVRTDCGTDSSTWASVHFNIGVLVMNMATSGTATINTCNAIIYDDGGPTGQYSSNCQSTLIINPATAGSWVSISGSSYTESTYDYLTIYEGAGTTGDVLWTDNGVTQLQNFGPFSSDAITVVFHSDGSVYYDGFQINVTCIPGPSCFRPSTFTATDVTSDSVYLEWLDTIGFEWLVAYGPSGFTLGGANTTYEAVTDTFIGIGNLTANTLYDFYVMTVCGSNEGDTSLSRMITVRTSCAPIDSLPFTENFETYGTGTTAFPSCWYKLGSTADRPYIHATTSYGHNGSHGLYFFASATGYCYGVMTPVDHSMDITTLQVSFWARQYSTSYNCDFVVGVMTNPTDASTFTPVAQVHPAGTTYEFFEVPLTTYTGTGRYIAFQAVQHPGTSTAIYMMLDDVTLDYTPDCPTPLSLNADSVTSDVVNLYWNDPTNSEWLVIYGPSGFNPDTAVVNTLNLTDTTVLITNLTANTLYDFYLAALCTDGDTTMFRMISVRTSCEPISILPFTENFETYGSGTTAFPTCWYKLGSTADRPYIHGTTSYGHNNTHGLYFYAASSGYCYGVMTPVDPTLDITTLQVSFWARQYSTSYNCDFVVGVMTNPTDATTFTPVLQVHPASTTYEHFEVPLAAYTGTGNYIAFKAVQHPGSSSAIYMMLDDVTIELTPDCPAVSNIILTGSDESSITLSWTENGSATSWNVEYGPHGFTLGSGTTDVVTSIPYTISNLSPNTEYDVYVSPVCGDDVPGIIMATFRTQCGPITVLPYFEGFESYPVGSSTSTVYEIPCWARLDNAGQNHFGYVNNSSSWSAGPHTGDKFIYYYLPSNAGTHCDWNITILPQIDTNIYPINTLQMSFWVRMNSASTSSFIEVGVISDITDQTTFTPVDTIPVSGDVHTLKTAYLSSFTGYGDRIAMRFHRTPTSTAHYFFIDDITIEPIPDCPAVSNITMTSSDENSISLSWNENGSATSWNVEYGPHGFTLGSGTTDVATAVPHTVSNLTANTEYDFYVTPVCTSGVAATSMASFRTACGAITVLPYIENFDSYTGSTATSPVPAGYQPPCWDFYNDGTRTNYMYAPYVYNSSTYAHSGSNCIRFYSYNSSGDSNQYLILPIIDTLTYPVSNLQVSFWVRGYSTSSSYRADVVVGVMTDILDESSFIPYDTILCASTTYSYHEVMFSQYTGNNGRITFLFPKPLTSSSYEYGYVDDVTVEPIPDCPPVSSIVLAGIDSNMLSVTWTENGNATSWNVEYGLHGFTIGTGTTDVVTTLPYTINGLTPNTEYDIYITPGCTSGTAPTRMGSFRTANTYVGLPFSCNFENATQNNLWTIENGNNTNKWFIGSATNNGGNNALYISDNANGTTNNYTISSSTLDYAFVDVMISTPGDYGYSFDWKCYGESSLDFIRAALVPVTETLTAGTSLPTGLSATSLPAGWISLDGNSKLNLQGSWQSRSDVVTVPSAGVYHLVFVFRCDASVGTQPPAAIDNVEFIQMTCPRPQNITLANLTQTSVDVSWVEPGAATSWQYQLGNNAPVIVTDTFCNLTGLTSNTLYTFRVRSICGQGDTSMWLNYSFRTPCGYLTLPYTQDFESETTSSSSTGSAFANCWTRLNNGTSYGGYPYVSSSSSYNHTTGGTKGLYWYNTTTTGTYGDYQCAVLPPVDPSVGVDSLQLSFWAKASSASSTPVFQIGVMTDPNNISTFVGVDTVTITTGTTWMLVEVPLTAYTGTGSYVAVKADRASWTAYVDDFTLEYTPTCISPRDIVLDTATTTTITLDWTDLNTPVAWEIRYEQNGTTNTVYTTSHPYTVTGLDALSSYNFKVRAICGYGDTSVWSLPTALSTTICDNAIVAENFDSTMTTTTSSYSPMGYSFYNYSYIQTIIDSAYLAEITGDINAMSFQPATTSQGNYYNHITVYMANIPDSLNLSSSFIHPSDVGGFDTVITDRDMCYNTTDWQLHGFDQPFTWDGHSNILVSVQRNHGSYSSGASFQAHTHPAGKGRYIYQDSGPYDPSTVSGGTAITAVGDIRLISCGAACATPVIVNTSDITYQGATVNWVSSASTIEIAVKAANEPTWPAETTVNNTTSFNFTGLQPETLYQFRVRAICDATEGLISDWAIGTFTTDDLPCFAPTDVTATPAYDAVTVNWTPGTSETLWNVHVWNSGMDTVVVVGARPAVIGGLAQTTAYNVAVQALCGGGVAESEYSDTISFTTLTCAPVSGVSVSNVTSSSATVTWNGTAQSYDIEYGDHGFGQGQGTKVNGVTAQTYTLQGLDPEAQYDVYVRANCDANNTSDWSPVVSFTTTQPEGINTVDGMSVTIFPNPTSTSTTISLSGVSGDVQISIVDMNGRTVMNETMSCDGSCTKQMEVSGLASGAYFVRVSGEGVNMVKKLVVK